MMTTEMVKCLAIYIFLLVSGVIIPVTFSASTRLSQTFPQLTPISHFRCFSQSFIESLPVTLFSSDPYDLSTAVFVDILSNVGKPSIHALPNTILQRSSATPLYTLMLFMKDNGEISCLYSAGPRPVANVTGIPLIADGVIATERCYTSSPLREVMLEIYQQFTLQSVVRTITWTCSLISPVHNFLFASLPPISVTVAQESRQDLPDFDPAPTSAALADHQASFIPDITSGTLSAHPACLSADCADCAQCAECAECVATPPVKVPPLATPTHAARTLRLRPRPIRSSTHAPPLPVLKHDYLLASSPGQFSSLVELGLAAALPAVALASPSYWLLTLPCHYRYLPTATIFVEQFSTDPVAPPPLRACEYLVDPVTTRVLCPVQLPPDLAVDAPLALVNVLHGVPLFSALLWIANHTVTVEHVLTQKSSAGDHTVTAVLAMGRAALYAPQPRHLAFLLQDRSAVQARPAISFVAAFDGTAAVLRGDRFSLEAAGLFMLPGLRVTVRSPRLAPPLSCACAVDATGDVYSCEVLETVVGVPSVVFSVYGAVLEHVSRPLYVTARAQSQGRMVHVLDARAVVAPLSASPASSTWVIVGSVLGGAALLAAGGWLILSALRRFTTSTVSIATSSAVPPGAPSSADAVPCAAARGGGCGHAAASELELSPSLPTPPAAIAATRHPPASALPSVRHFTPQGAAPSTAAAHWTLPVHVSRSISSSRSHPDGMQSALERSSAAHVLIPVAHLRASSSCPMSTVSADACCTLPAHAPCAPARWSPHAAAAAVLRPVRQSVAAAAYVMCTHTPSPSRSPSSALSCSPPPLPSRTQPHPATHTRAARRERRSPSRSVTAPHVPQRRVRSLSPLSASHTSHASRRWRGRRLRRGARRSEPWLLDALVVDCSWTPSPGPGPNHCSWREVGAPLRSALVEVAASAQMRPQARARSQPPAVALLPGTSLLGPGAAPLPSLPHTHAHPRAPPAAGGALGTRDSNVGVATQAAADSSIVSSAHAPARVPPMRLTTVAAAGTRQVHPHRQMHPGTMHTHTRHTRPTTQRRIASYLAPASLVDYDCSVASCGAAPTRRPSLDSASEPGRLHGRLQHQPPRRRSFSSHTDAPGAYHAGFSCPTAAPGA